MIGVWPLDFAWAPSFVLPFYYIQLRKMYWLCRGRWCTTCSAGCLSVSSSCTQIPRSCFTGCLLSWPRWTDIYMNFYSITIMLKAIQILYFQSSQSRRGRGLKLPPSNNFATYIFQLSIQFQLLSHQCREVNCKLFYKAQCSPLS